ATRQAFTVINCNTWSYASAGDSCTSPCIAAGIRVSFRRLRLIGMWKRFDSARGHPWRFVLVPLYSTESPVKVTGGRRRDRRSKQRVLGPGFKEFQLARGRVKWFNEARGFGF